VCVVEALKWAAFVVMGPVPIRITVRYPHQRYQKKFFARDRREVGGSLQDMFAPKLKPQPACNPAQIGNKLRNVNQ
jgi:hypothetical protein